MSRILVETLQNVPIEYETANLGDRLLARIIDIIIWVAYIIAIFWLNESANLHIRGVAVYFFALPIVFYDLTMELFLEGQSVGKMIMKIRVVNEDGSMPGLGGYLMRWIMGLIELPPFGGMGIIAILVMAFNKKGQRLGDIAAGTTVIRLKFKTKFEDTIYRNLNVTYQAMFPQVDRLTDRDLTIINDILKLGDKNPDDPALEKVARRVQEVLNIQTQLQPYPFLHRILSDYNHVTGVEKDF